MISTIMEIRDAALLVARASVNGKLILLDCSSHGVTIAGRAVVRRHGEDVMRSCFQHTSWEALVALETDAGAIRAELRRKLDVVIESLDRSGGED